MKPATDVRTRNDANRLGLCYRCEAARLPWNGPIWDCHTHIGDLPSAYELMNIAELFGVTKLWTMAPLPLIDQLREAFGQRIAFIAVPDWRRAQEPETFTTRWLQEMRGFAERGVRICKFWAAPRGRDVHPALRLDHPLRWESMRLARELGMMFMVHVADPDTWFATHYADARRYGAKAEHYEPLQRMLDVYGVPTLAAHMAGHPEDLDHLQRLLDRHPNLYLDTSATKWMVRELSKRPDELRAFCRQNAGRVLWGTDIVAAAARGKRGFDLHASRFWAMRTLFETRYDGASPIVDPDLPLVDPTAGPMATAQLRGAGLDPATLQMLYHDAAERLLLGSAAPEAAEPEPELATTAI